MKYQDPQDNKIHVDGLWCSEVATLSKNPALIKQRY
jgi:hypothetical protein